MTARSILITGGAGMLATDLAAFLSAQKDYNVVLLSHDSLDVVQRHDVDAAMTTYHPDCVINTAVCHVEESEESPQAARSVANMPAPPVMRLRTTLSYLE